MTKYLSIFVLLVSFNVQAKPPHNEAYYQDILCAELGGETEVLMFDRTRVDCLIPGEAIEIDFQAKYYNCFSQAVLYAQYTERKPVCYLIVNDKRSEYVRRFGVINSYFHHKIELRFIEESN